MTPHEKRLATLLSHSWTCEHPNSVHNPVGRDTQPRRSVYLEGQISGVRREAFLSIQCGLVMLIAGEDLAYEAFVDLLEGKNPQAAAMTPGDSRQGSLFD